MTGNGARVFALNPKLKISFLIRFCCLIILQFNNRFRFPLWAPCKEMAWIWRKIRTTRNWPALQEFCDCYPQWMGRWGWRVSVAVSRIVSASKSINKQELSRNPRIRSQNPPLISGITSYFLSFRRFSALPESPRYVEEFDVNRHGFDGNKILEELLEDEEAGKISVKAFFLCTRFIYCFIHLWLNESLI